MIEGRKILQISKVSRNIDGSLSHTIVEREHRVVLFRRLLPAGPLNGGGVRLKDMVQFYADPGGLRTVYAEDLIIP